MTVSSVFPDGRLAGMMRRQWSATHPGIEMAQSIALAMGGVLGADFPGSIQRNMPRVIPTIVLGRLAVDRQHQGRQLGRSLLNDAVQRSLHAAADVSARLMVVHALTLAAEAFYINHGFRRLPAKTATLALDLAKVAAEPAGKPNAT